MGRNTGGGTRGGWLFLALLLVATARVLFPEGLRRTEALLLVVPGHVLRGVLMLWQPGTVTAASRAEPDSGARLAEAVQRRLRDRARPLEGLGAPVVLANVREVRASAVGRRLDLLVLDLSGGQGGEPVVSGDVLLGFLAAPRPDCPAVVELLGHVPRPGTAPRRVLGTARPAGPVPADADEVLRFVVEPAGASDPFPLHVVRPDRPQVNTWRDGVEFVARTLALPRLLVPAGLRLGRVRTHGYREPDFVLDWYLEPELDPRALHTVAVLTAGAPLAAQAGTERVPVRALGRFALTGGRELLLVTGAELDLGCAVLAGERLLGRVVARAGPVLTVRPFGDRGQVWPAVLWEESRGGPCDVLLEPLVSQHGRVRCRVRSARLDERVTGDPMGAGGVLFTGCVSPDTPAGLLLGEFRFVAADELEVQAAELRLVPRQLHGIRGRPFPFPPVVMMVRWPALLLLVVLLELLEIQLAHARYVPDLAVGLVVFCGLFVRIATLPAVLVVVALARAPLCGTNPSVEFLLLGSPVLLLVPLRRWFFQGSMLYLSALSVAVALLLLWAHRLELPAPTEALIAERPLWPVLLAAAVLGPFLVLLLRALPPSRWFVAEEAR